MVPKKKSLLTAAKKNVITDCTQADKNVHKYQSRNKRRKHTRKRWRQQSMKSLTVENREGQNLGQEAHGTAM